MRKPIATPGALQQSNAGGGSAVDFATGGTIQTRKVANVNANRAAMTMKFTNTTASSAVNASPVFLKGAGNGTKTLSNITYVGDFSTIADLMDYLDKVPCMITKITIQTSHTANFSNIIKFADKKPNNTDDVTTFDLSEFRQGTGGSILDVLVIPDPGVNLTPLTTLSMVGDMAGDSWIKFTFEVPAIGGKVIEYTGLRY